MSSLIPLNQRLSSQPARSSSWVSQALTSGRTRRELARLSAETALRVANVQATGIIQTEKVHELDALSQQAMTGHALLTRLREVLAGDDLLLADELRFFTDLSRVGKGEVIADTVSIYCRESRGIR